VISPLGKISMVCRMALAAQLLVGLVALIHVYILILEMFLWRSDRTRATFGLTAQFAAESAPMAANQGLYNGFLAAGLIYGLIADSLAFQVFFLSCVFIAGIFGAATAARKIIFVQTLPAAIALAVVLLAR
jgi:putative membrane protein